MDTITRLRIGDKLRKMKGKEEGKEKRARSFIFLPIVNYERTYSADRLYVLAEQVIWENS